MCNIIPRLKDSLCSDSILRPPCYDHPFCLQTDASSRGIGAGLTQKDDDLTKHPVAFSRKLAPRETRYSATEKEGLAVVEACKHYLPYLLGHHFDIWTDHKALSFLNHQEPRSPRLARWMDILRQFSFTIYYRPGNDNCNADGLSHQAWPPSLPDDSQEEGGGVGNQIANMTHSSPV